MINSHLYLHEQRHRYIQPQAPLPLFHLNVMAWVSLSVLDFFLLVPLRHVCVLTHNTHTYQKKRRHTCIHDAQAAIGMRACLHHAHSHTHTLVLTCSPHTHIYIYTPTDKQRSLHFSARCCEPDGDSSPKSPTSKRNKDGLPCECPAPCRPPGPHYPTAFLPGPSPSTQRPEASQAAAAATTTRDNTSNNATTSHPSPISTTARQQQLQEGERDGDRALLLFLCRPRTGPTDRCGQESDHPQAGVWTTRRQASHH